MSGNNKPHTDDGFFNLKKQLVDDYNRRKKADEDVSSRSLGESSDEVEEEASSARRLTLNVDSVGFDNDERQLHHTEKYELMDGDSPTPIFRRGQPFAMYLRLNNTFNVDDYVFQLVLSYGPNPSYNRGTKFNIRLSDGANESTDQWWMWLDGVDGYIVKLKLFSPVKCQVGLWRFNIQVVEKGTQPSSDLNFLPQDVFYILFNPWSKNDDVYLDGETLREEFVLCDSGVLFSGVDTNPISKGWVYGQFDYAVLPAIVLLLEKDSLSHSERGSPVAIARALAALINSNDDDGLVQGNWSGRFDGGTPPEAWTGSTAIFEQYLSTGGKPVMFGQCWVYAGCLTTAMRSLGIPCRTVTCYHAAHDTDNTLTVDSYYNQNGGIVQVPGKTDSIWNYHCWNEVWMTRPDLPPGYDGWQVVDGTPQELSQGKYRVGPAPVKAVHEGEVGLSYDVCFVYSEVNADICYLKEDPQSPWGWRLCKVDMVGIGKLIVTQNCTHTGNHDMFMEDITDNYKYPEGTQQERVIYNKALQKFPKMQKYYDNFNELSCTSDVQFTLQKVSSLKFGEPFEVSVNVENTSSELRSVAVQLDVSTVFHTGKILSNIKHGEVNVDLLAKESKTVKMAVSFEDYRKKLNATTSIKLVATCNIDQTKQCEINQNMLEVIMPELVIQAPPSVREGEILETRFVFKNSFQEELTNCQLTIEAPGLQRPKTLPQSNVPSGGEMVQVVRMIPRRKGPCTIIGIFSSDQLANIQGQATVNVTS